MRVNGEYKDDVNVRGNDTPTEVEWTEEVDYDAWNDKAVTNHYATCPTCKSWPLYGANPCQYCGQALIVKYPEGVRTQSDAHKTEYVGARSDEKGHLVCDECGGNEFEFLAHMDCVDAYGSNYRCCKCGKHVESWTKRETEGMYIF